MGSQREIDGFKLNAVILKPRCIVNDLNLYDILREEYSLWDHFFNVIRHWFLLSSCLKASCILTNDLKLQERIMVKLSRVLKFQDILSIQSDFNLKGWKFIFCVIICDITSSDFKFDC